MRGREFCSGGIGRGVLWLNVYIQGEGGTPLSLSFSLSLYPPPPRGFCSLRNSPDAAIEVGTPPTVDRRDANGLALLLFIRSSMDLSNASASSVSPVFVVVVVAVVEPSSSTSPSSRAIPIRGASIAASLSSSSSEIGMGGDEGTELKKDPVRGGTVRSDSSDDDDDGALSNTQVRTFSPNETLGVKDSVVRIHGSLPSPYF